MANQLLKGRAFSPGDTVDAADLNILVDGATAQPPIISDLGTPVSALGTDQVMINRGGVLHRSNISTFPNLAGVTSITLDPPNFFSLTGANPVVSTGTWTLNWNQVNPNRVLAGPGSGTALGAPTFRRLVPADLDQIVVVSANIIDLDLGKTFFKSILAPTLAMRLKNGTPGQVIKVIMIQGGGGNATVTWDTDAGGDFLRWPGGTPPVMSTGGAGVTDIYEFTLLQVGTGPNNYYGVRTGAAFERMTLGDMITLITTELGVYDDTNKALCDGYIQKEYGILWDKYPWGDTQGYSTVLVEPYVAIVNYPDGMDRIITIRVGSGSTPSPPGIPDVPDIPPPQPPVYTPVDFRFLDPVDATFLIESDPNIFEQVGYVKYYEDVGNRAQRRIRIYPMPEFGVNLFFVGKMICPGLATLTDEPLIRNIDAVLIAYATADMLRRQRQYAKADLEYKKALELEQAAWNLEQQQANLPRRTKATTVAGNSLGEMTDAVCTICGQWTPDYRLIIREFLRRNYQTAYDTFLFPESLVMVRVPYTSEQVILPAYIDRVLGIRGTNNTRLFPADAELILDITPESFDEIGEPVAYTTLTPVAVSTLPSVTTRLLIASQNPSDRTKMAIRGEVLATGQEFEEEITLNGVTGVLTRYTYDIPLTAAKDITFGDVTVNAESDGRLLELIPASVRELKHQRLWFLPVPNSDTLLGPPVGDGSANNVGYFTCLVLGKRVIRPLLTDQDTPIITGIQQVLIAAAAGDLFTKLEKPDLAAAMLKKADGSMAVLKAKNTDQAASAPRFVPQIEPRAYIADYGCCR